MLTGMNPASPEWYVPISQRELSADQQTRFRIRGLIGSEVTDVRFSEEDGWLLMKGAGVDACIRAGLLGWENFNGTDGKPIEFMAHDWKANTVRIPPIVLGEVAREIWNRTKLSEEAQKN